MFPRLPKWTRRARNARLNQLRRRTLLTGPERLEDRQLLATWSGDIPAGTVWHNTEVQQIIGNVHIPAEVTLTIEPGTVVKFDAGHGYSIQVEGRILAQGTAAQSIVLTSSYDDTAGGDTNQDQNNTFPA